MNDLVEIGDDEDVLIWLARQEFTPHSKSRIRMHIGQSLRLYDRQICTVGDLKRLVAADGGKLMLWQNNFGKTSLNALRSALQIDAPSRARCPCCGHLL